MNPNRLSVIAGWLLIWAAIALAGWKLIRPQPPAPVPAPNRDEILLKEQDLRRIGRELADRRQSELEQALGGPIEAAFKNPHFSLREALQKAALAAAPSNANVHVEVDRFTEFTITISAAQPLATNVMTSLTRRLLPQARRYLHALRFSADGAIVAELDREDIEFIEDWVRAPEERIVALLTPEIAPAQSDSAALEAWKQQREIAQALAADPALLGKLQGAEKLFVAQIQASYEDINAAINLSQEAIALEDKAKFDLASRLDKLQSASKRAQRARLFWNDPGQNLRALLSAQEISGDTLEAFSKHAAGLLRNDPAKSAKVFEALEAAIESSRFFIQLAGEREDAWRFDPRTGQFGFTHEEFSRRFQRARQQLISDQQALQAALRVWSDGN